MVFEVVFIISGVENSIENWVSSGNQFQFRIVVVYQVFVVSILNGERMGVVGEQFIVVFVVIGIFIGGGYIQMAKEGFILQVSCIGESCWIEGDFIVIDFCFFRIVVIIVGIFFICRNKVVLAFNGEEVDCIGLIYIVDWLVGEENIVDVVGGIQYDVFFCLVFIVQWNDSQCCCRFDVNEYQCVIFLVICIGQGVGFVDDDEFRFKVLSNSGIRLKNMDIGIFEVCFVVVKVGKVDGGYIGVGEVGSIYIQVDNVDGVFGVNGVVCIRFVFISCQYFGVIWSEGQYIGQWADFYLVQQVVIGILKCNGVIVGDFIVFQGYGYNIIGNSYGVDIVIVGCYVDCSDGRKVCWVGEVNYIQCVFFGVGEEEVL